MNFEQLLASLTTLPQKFLIKSCESLYNKYRKYKQDFEKTGGALTDLALPEELKDIIEIKPAVTTLQPFSEWRARELQRFDSGLTRIKIPIILLERLKKEYDDSHELSKVLGKPEE
jgi:hypothetical protein